MIRVSLQSCLACACLHFSFLNQGNYLQGKLVAHVYFIHEHQGYSPASVADGAATQKKMRLSKSESSRRSESEGATPTGLVYFEVLEGTSFFIPQHHFLRNMRHENYCEGCNKLDLDGSSIVCDGTRPSLFGHGYPDGAKGKQFACKLGILCVTCYDKHMRETRKRYWFCKKCVAGPTELIDAWSDGIRYPLFLLPPGILHIESTPYVASDTMLRGQPCDIFDRILQRSSRLRAEALRCRGGDETARRQVDASALFFRRCRARAMSLADMEAVLSVLHDLHEQGILLEEGSGFVGDLTLPKSGYTLESRAEGSVIQDEDIDVTEYKIDQTPLLQMQEYVRVWTVDFKMLLQAILLDDLFPPGSCWLQKPDDAV